MLSLKHVVCQKFYLIKNQGVAIIWLAKQIDSVKEVDVFFRMKIGGS